jgi:RNA polymerase sigma-70 factor (ECF subfamily)
VAEHDDLAAAAPLVRGAQEDTLVLGELRQALARLPREQRVALVAVAARGMRYGQLAAATGCAVGTAKSRVCRARNRLHGLLLGPRRRRGAPARSCQALSAQRVSRRGAWRSSMVAVRRCRG